MLEIISNTTLCGGLEVPDTIFNLTATIIKGIKIDRDLLGFNSSEKSNTATAMKNKYVQAVIRGMKPCIIGIVLATGVYMIFKNCFMKNGVFVADFISLAITTALFVLSYIYKKKNKKQLSPIMLIIVSAVLGVIAYGV